MKGGRKMILFKGSGVALVTPFKDDQIDYVKLRQLIEWHICQKTDAIIITGTTGESPTLSIDEKHKLFTEAVKTANKRIPIIAGTGSNSTSTTIELSLFAEKEGVDGLLIVTPYYNKPTQKGLYEHFAQVASNVNIPIIMYNVPSRTGVNLLPSQLVVTDILLPQSQSYSLPF